MPSLEAIDPRGSKTNPSVSRSPEGQYTNLSVLNRYTRSEDSPFVAVLTGQRAIPRNSRFVLLSLFDVPAPGVQHRDRIEMQFDRLELLPGRRPNV